MRRVRISVGQAVNGLVYAMMLAVLTAFVIPTVGCDSQKVGDTVLAVAKATVSTLSVTAAEAGPLVDDFEADGTLDHATAASLRAELRAAGDSISDLRARLGRYQHFDPAARADLVRFRDDGLAFLQRANDNGLAHIKDPQKRARVSAILSGVRVALTVLDSALVGVGAGSTQQQSARTGTRAGDGFGE
jgi:hypothetical protein